MVAKPEQKKKDVYFTIRRVGDVWNVEGALDTQDMKDVLDIIMILMTNSVRVALTITDVTRSLKPMEKALTAQLKDIIKAEAREYREEKRKADVAHAKELLKDTPSKEVSDEQASKPAGQEATADTSQEQR